jgi:hypothetical protein
MNKKQANLSFHYSEKLKSNLFLISGLLERLENLKGERLEGGKEVAEGLLDAFKKELGIAEKFLPCDEVSSIEKIEKEFVNLEEYIEFHYYSQAWESLGKVISYVTTISNKHIGILIEEDLI